MKHKIFPLLLLLLSMRLAEAQTTACRDIAIYNKYTKEGKKRVAEGEYIEALKFYESAKDWCEEKKAEVDKLITDMVTKINRERELAENALKLVKEEKEKTQEALDKALKMQNKMEIAVFDKVVKEKLENWSGYDNRLTINSAYSRESNFDDIDSLDLSQNDLLSLSPVLSKCHNLVHINLLGNENINWQSIENLRNLPKLKSIYVSINDLSDIDSSFWHKITGIEILKKGIKEIPQSIFKQKQLKYLDLGKDFFSKKMEIDNQINSIPIELFSLTELEYLNLSHCQITSLPKEVGQLKNLENLDISHNQLQELPKEVGQLKSLENLYCFGNKLDNMPVEIIQLSNLQRFSCASNHLKILPEKIGKLKNLLFFDCSNNHLQELPKEITQTFSLKELICRYNKLQELPKEIYKLKNLKKLDISHNQLQELPKEIKQLQNLEDLDFSSNELIVLPSYVFNLKKLKTLVIGFNKIKMLPEEVGQLSSLEYLFCDGLGIESLPREIGKLKNLKRLSCSSNKLKTLPKEIGKLNKLEFLICYSNSLRQIPSEIGKLKKLYSFECYYNQLDSLPREVGELQALERLSCSSNKLKTLPKEIGNLKSLVYLNLDNNNLKILPKEIGGLSQLKWLSCANNELQNLPSQIGGLKELNNLNVIENYLTSLPLQIKELQKLQYLNLNENPIKPEYQKKIKKSLPNCQIRFSKFSYESLAWAYYKKGILENNTEDFLNVKHLNFSDFYVSVRDIHFFKKNLPKCNIIVNIKNIKNKDKNLDYFISNNQIENQIAIKERREQLELAKYIYYKQPDTQDNIYWVTRSMFKLTLAFQRINNIDSTFKYYQETIKFQKKMNPINQNNKLLKGAVYNAYSNFLFYKKRDFKMALYYQKKQVDLLLSWDKIDLESNYNFLAACYLYNQKYQKAEEYANKSLEINPNKNYAYLSLARALLLQDRFEEAKKIYLDKKEELGPDDTKYKTVALTQFESMKKAGVIPAERMRDVEKIIELLEE